MGSHITTFSAIDPSYTLPNNVAVITLQVHVAEILVIAIFKLFASSH